MSAFAAAVGALFADPNIGRDAIYTPEGGAPVLVRVVARRADAVRRDRVPVIVEIPYDLIDTPASGDGEWPLPAQSDVLRPHELEATPTIDAADLTRVAEALQGAERPLILAGRGALTSGAAKALKEIGDRLGALFATSLMAQGFLPRNGIWGWLAGSPR